MKDVISDFLNSQQERQEEFLAALVKSPTDNPPGNCAAHSNLLAKLLRNLDFEVEEHPVPDATVKAAGMQSVTNIIVRHKFGDGPTIALNAHGDVVPPGSGWQYDPYGAEIVTEDGQRKMFGRGVAVSKSDLAGYTWALLALKEAQSKGRKLAGTGELHFTYDEEIGGTVGPQWILEQGISSPDYVICAGFSHAVITRHNGCLHLEVTINGKIGHAAEPERAVDALEVTTKVLSSLYASREALSKIKVDIPGIEHPTLVVGLINGGVNTNVVPDKISFRIDRRIVPGESADAVQEQITSLIKAEVEKIPGVEFTAERIMAAAPLEHKTGWEEIAGALRSSAILLTGETIPYVGAKLFTDARLYAEKGIPVVLFGAGPKTLAEAGGHNSDEKLDLNDLRRGTEITALAVSELLKPQKK